jgi:hypothetical protein
MAGTDMLKYGEMKGHSVPRAFDVESPPQAFGRLAGAVAVVPYRPPEPGVKLTSNFSTVTVTCMECRRSLIDARDASGKSDTAKIHNSDITFSESIFPSLGLHM